MEMFREMFIIYAARCGKYVYRHGLFFFLNYRLLQSSRRHSLQFTIRTNENGEELHDPRKNIAALIFYYFFFFYSSR